MSIIKYINSIKMSISVIGSDNNMNINAIKIKCLIAAQGITQAQLAGKSKISRQNISNILRRGTCQPKTAGKIAAALSVDVAEILAECEKDGVCND